MTVKLTRKLKNQESGLKSLLNMLTCWESFYPLLE